MVEVALRNRQGVVTPTVDPVTDADRNLLPAGQYIQLGEEDVGEPVALAAASTTRASNQPQRRLRPVVVPNSAPISRMRSPSSSRSSVGIGPSPTRVV